MTDTTAMFDEVDVRHLTANIWTSLVGGEVGTGRPVAAGGVDPGLVSGIIHVSGEWEGAVVLRCSESLARQATSSLIGEPDCTDDDVRDAVCELTNMTGGGVKALLPTPTKLSLPTFVQGVHHTVSVPGSAVAGEWSFPCGGGQIVVRILEKTS